ncbi:hypothetical protein M6B38_164655 [Iris pallida]|uniref:Uncharacterized protein n=1 Tax=Iris pallida TaxID=29817 RepID=A0AAX6EWT7_IRIPA|nr:hypothetical protein M6B38_164650 [Iris pallida]KAJ6808622.1 hypothetical protein M6B38_164655 [Iris pallida]
MMSLGQPIHYRVLLIVMVHGVGALEDLVRPIWPEPGILTEKDGAMT